MVNDYDYQKLRDENEALRLKYEALVTKERYLDVINSFATSLIEQNTIDEIAWDVCKNAIAKLGLVDCVIYLFEDDREFLTQRAAYGPKNPEAFDILDPIRIKVGEGIVGAVAASGSARSHQ